jgi:TatD DNase family protein
MTLIDSHVHLTDPAFDGEADRLIERAKEASVGHMVVICTNRKATELALELKKKYPKELSIVAGTTPHDASTLGEEDFSYFEDLARGGFLAALGESGLDYHYEHSPREKQKEMLHRYLGLAQELSLPVVIHCRDAFSDFFSIVDQYDVQGVLHCFTGTVKEAKGVVDRGWYLSLSGIVTFKKSLELQEVAKTVPLKRLLIETDAPYLAPQTKRGKRNEPSFLPEVAQKIAELKGVDFSSVAFVTTSNAKNLFLQ